MSTHSRNKGAGYEREIAKLFTEQLDIPECKRKLGQARESGNDLDVGPLVIELKRRKRLLTLEKWLDQAGSAAMLQLAAARVAQKPRPYHALYPLVVVRADQGQNMVLLSLDSFLELAGPEIRAQMREST